MRMLPADKIGACLSLGTLIRPKTVHNNKHVPIMNLYGRHEPDPRRLPAAQAEASGSFEWNYSEGSRPAKISPRKDGKSP